MEEMKARSGAAEPLPAAIIARARMEGESRILTGVSKTT